MALKDIFTMIKTDKYTADGREELNKAREADVEDRTYQIGEISEKTGLQKTANGWVKPKKGNQPAAESKPAAKKTHWRSATPEENKRDIEYLRSISRKLAETKAPGAKPGQKGAGKSVTGNAEQKADSGTKNNFDNLRKGSSGKNTADFTKYKKDTKLDLEDSAPRVLTGDTRIRIRKA